jgi:hypothetical protein
MLGQLQQDKTRFQESVTATVKITSAFSEWTSSDYINGGLVKRDDKAG